MDFLTNIEYTISMCIRFLKKSVVPLMVLSFFILFDSCGELDTLLSSKGTYRVKALVNGSSLEDCSLIRSNDKIRPGFANSIVDDPDITGLLVFLENARGEVVGGKTRYVLQAYADEYSLPETESGQETLEPAAAEEPVIQNEEAEPAEEEPKLAGENTVEGEAGGSTEESAGELIGGPIGEKPILEKKTTTKIPEPAKEPKPETNDTVVIVKHLDDTLPYFPLPNDLGLGQYTLVFQVLGGKYTLHRTEMIFYYLGDAVFNLKDIQMYLPGVSTGSRLIPPGTTVMLEAHVDFDKRLDPYIVWYKGKIVVGEGKLAEGAGSIFWKAPEQTGFHSVRAEVFPFRLQQGLSGTSREIALPVSEKAVRTGCFFDDPLVIPVRTTLPVAAVGSEDQEAVPVFPAGVEYSPPELMHWYELGGNLRDSKTSISTERALIPVSEKTPRWTPVAYSYGLATGSDDAYMVSPVAFLRGEAETGGGQLLFHIQPVSDGVIFSAFFTPGIPSGENVAMHLTRKENTLVLSLSAPGAADVEMPVSVASFETSAYIIAVVDFFIRPYRFEAKLSLGTDAADQSEAKSVRLLNPLSGECRMVLGGTGTAETGNREPQKKEDPPVSQNMEAAPAALDNESPNVVPDAEEADTPVIKQTAEQRPEPAALTEEKTYQTNTVWDEFAVLYSDIPLIAEEPSALLAAGPLAEGVFAGEEPGETEADGKPEPAPQTVKAAARFGASPVKAKPEAKKPASVEQPQDQLRAAEEDAAAEKTEPESAVSEEAVIQADAAIEPAASAPDADAKQDSLSSVSEKT
jgi:hypothetical protein